MNNNLKKTKERKIIENLKSIYPEFPQGEIEETEAPDFIIHSSKMKIGVELVNYIRGQNKTGSPLRENEKIIISLTELAKEGFEKLSKANLVVSLHWKNDFPITRKLKTQIINKLSKLIYDYCPEKNGELREISWKILLNYNLDNYLNFILISRFDELTENYWYSPKAGFIGPDEFELQSLISLKNNKVKEYKNKCDTVWLIIFAEGLDISSTVTHKNLSKFENYNFDSHFDRVIFFR